jgi:hypothetical protein
MSRNSKIRIIYGSVIAAVFLCWILFGENSISQRWHMNLARKHGLLLERMMQSHPEFRDVKFEPSTAHNGCLVVLGWVETEAELSDLKIIVTNSKPPVFVFYSVKSEPAEQKDSR